MPTPLFQDPQAATAISLLQQPGEYRARALSEIARAQADAQVQSAQAWAGGIQGVANTVAQIPQQFQQQRAAQQAQTLTQQQIAANARAAENAALVDQTKQRINALSNDPEVFNEDGTFNAQALQRKLGAVTPGVQGPNQAPDVTTLFGILEPINESLSKARKARAEWEDAKVNHIAKVAAGALDYGQKHDGDFFTPATLGLASLQKSGWLTPKELNEYVVQMVENREQLPAQLESLVSRSTLPPIKLGEKERLVSALRPSQVLASGAPERPNNQVELEFDALDLKSPTQKISAAALAAQPGHNIPLNELLYKAIAEKNEGKVKDVLRAIREDALAKHIDDPNVAAMRALQMEIARERLDNAKEKHAPIDIEPEIQTSLINDGTKYINSAAYASVADRDKARKVAESMGIAVLNRDEAAGVLAADRAVLNLDTQWSTVRDLFPKDAPGRPLGAAQNTLEKVFQTNPDLGAYPSWRAAAIQAIQAIAEQRAGLRLNQAEIALMIDAIPKLTDTRPTAEKKLQSIGTLLRNKVNTLLTKDRTTLRVQGGLLAPAPDTADQGPAEPREIKRKPVTSATAPPPPPPAAIVPPPQTGAAPRGPVIRRPVGR